MYFRSTLRPEDISAWGQLQHVPSNVSGSLGYTYPNPVLLPAEDNKLYLFWRGADWSEAYATRTVDGRWSRAHELIRVPGQRPYVKVDSNGSDEIAFAFTDGHPRNVLSSIYYAAYRAGSLWTAGGHWISRITSGPIRASAGRSRLRRAGHARLRVGVGCRARGARAPGDRVRDVPVHQASRVLVRALDRDKLGLASLDVRRRHDQPWRDRVRLFGRNRARSLRPLDRLPLSTGHRRVGDRTTGRPTTAAGTGATAWSFRLRAPTTSGQSCHAGGIAVR